MIVSFCGDAFVADTDAEYLEQKIKNIVEYLIKDGKVVFISDGYSEFGLLCKNVIDFFKEKYPYIAYISAMNFIAPDYKKGYYDVQLRGSIQKQSISVAKKKCREYMISKADVLVSYNKTSGSEFLENTEGKDVIKINM